MARRLPFPLGVAALTVTVVATALAHHGHILMFLGDLRDLVARKLPKRYRDYQCRVGPSMLQVYRDDPSVHYEVWVQRTTRSLGIGLHFEGDRESNRRWADAVAERAVELRAQLGAGVELERWTKGWARVYESRRVGGAEWHPKYDLTPELAREVGARLVRYVEVLEPVLAEERRRTRS